MIFYTTSQDYPRLKQLLDKGYEIVCFSLKSKECALAKKQTFCDGQNFDYNFGVSSNLVGINFQYSLYIPFFASWKTITYKCWHV